MYLQYGQLPHENKNQFCEVYYCLLRQTINRKRCQERKKGKKKTKADLLLNDGATTTVVGGGPSTTKDRKVKQRYEDGHSVVSSNMPNMSTNL